MIAVDTNVVVRLIVADDEGQLMAALDLVSRDDAYVSLTVLMETEWVLRSRYAYSRGAIHAAFDALPALLRLHVEAPGDVAWALKRYALGGELADYLHIASARTIGRFASFEKKLADRADPDSPATVELIG
ncbi:type II toxin-antitoxin system VapC family toxin [Sphingomonas sp. A2-49]|uniref:type II toxin-antitoxin system VapC family toxin n=1 Tax=Sphingomonas sp. A2-49 TaxID=1391375 RepID=UPI0021CFF0A6|nr:type II toxin-antitoxin system VapC family toxin [Sphingomonas sp. A2-49]MCU6453589.1 type II toxin-antitoxin system VapC family toxin [Sphingomonas sp. A2-49]